MDDDLGVALWLRKPPYDSIEHWKYDGWPLKSVEHWTSTGKKTYETYETMIWTDGKLNTWHSFLDNLRLRPARLAGDFACTGWHSLCLAEFGWVADPVLPCPMLRKISTPGSSLHSAVIVVSITFAVCCHPAIWSCLVQRRSTKLQLNWEVSDCWVSFIVICSYIKLFNAILWVLLLKTGC